MDALTIGALARDTGVKIPTIRFYEHIGLLPAPPRTASGRRSYAAEDARLLRFIRHARELGFDIGDVRGLLAMAREPQASCHRADSIARRHLVDIERRIAQLGALRDELARMVDECGHGRICDCRVIEALGEDHVHPPPPDRPKRKRRAATRSG